MYASYQAVYITSKYVYVCLLSIAKQKEICYVIIPAKAYNDHKISQNLPHANRALFQLEQL